MYTTFVALLVTTFVLSHPIRVQADELAAIEAALALGIAFRVDDESIDRIEGRGTNLGDSSMADFRALPVPAIYMIDKTGKVVYSFVEVDYRIRLPAKDLLRAAEAFTD